MANTIKIKRSTTTAQPANSTLAAGELAYSSSSGKLFIGHPDGSTAAPQLIGYLSPTEGTLTASKPIVTDSNSKIDRINVDNLRLDGNTISSTSTNGDIIITPNGTGDIVLDGQNWPQADGDADQYLKTDGSGQLSWATIPSGSFTISDNASTPNTDTFTTGNTLVFEGSTGITTTVSDDNIAIAITAGGVDTTQLAADAVTGAKVADDAIDSEHIADGAIDAVHLASNSVTNAKLADDAVDSAEIADGAIDTVHIGDDQVTYAKIQNVSATNRILGRDSAGAGVIEEITPANLRTMINVADGATANTGALADLDTVSASEIDDSAVTSAKLATGAVATAKIADLAVTTAKIAASAVTNAKMAANSVDSDQYVDGSIDSAHLASNSVTNAKIASGAVDTGELAADAVTGAKIADDAIDSEHITDGSVDNVHLANSSVTVGSTAISLGSSATTIDGLNTVHGIDGSGTDQAGTDLTIQGGGGTGTGAGGSILFQVADGGSSGSSVNTFATALTIADDGDITAAQNFTVSGNLTVSGTTTTVNSETVTFDDNILVLNNNYAGNSPTENAGFEVERGTAHNNVALRWNETSDKWQITEDGSAYKNLVHADSDVDGGTF